MPYAGNSFILSLCVWNVPRHQPAPLCTTLHHPEPPCTIELQQHGDIHKPKLSHRGSSSAKGDCLGVRGFLAWLSGWPKAERPTKRSGQKGNRAHQQGDIFGFYHIENCMH